MSVDSAILHATTVAIGGRALLILGPSGSGKSSLAFQLLALGGDLVADDRTIVTREGALITASAPDPIAGKIEARGVGIIEVKAVGPTPIGLVVDLDQREAQRLPDPHTQNILGVTLPCLHNPESVHFPSALLLYMKSMQTPSRI